MFDTLTRQENTELWNRLSSATRKLGNHRRDLPYREWEQVAGAELDIIDAREELTAAYGKLRADA